MGLFGSSPKPKIKVVDYYASVHYGICHGPVDQFLELWYGEKRVWSGTMTGRGRLSVNRKGLFGGNKVEGGLEGWFEVYPGAADQLLSAEDCATLQRNGAGNSADPNQNPGYRGIFSIFMRGTPTTGPGPTHTAGSDQNVIDSLLRIIGQSGRRGANIGSNTAFIKSFWFKIRRSPKQCPFNTVITVDGMQLANPAGIIYECMVNDEWGMGLPSSLLNDSSFSAAATTLLNEGFGLAILWHRQESVEDFIGNILRHIDASLCFDPYTGRFRLKLIRGDYDIEQLPVFGPGDCVIETFDRAGWGETVNEMNVKWTSPLTEKLETVTVHDTANISVQGALVSETREYAGIRTADLALRVATRELLVAGSTMARAELTVNRKAWQLLPGDAMVLHWPEYSFDRLPMRVTNVDYGRPGDSRIKVTLIEDIFGLPEQSYVSSGGTDWVNPAVEPTPLTDARVFSIPFYHAFLKAGSTVVVEEYPTGQDLAAMVGTHTLAGAYNFDIVEATTDDLGNAAWQLHETTPMATKGRTVGNLGLAVQSQVGLTDFTQGGGVMPGVLLWIGPFNNTGELVFVQGYDAVTEIATIERGVLDTVPREWPSNTEFWALDATVIGLVDVDRNTGSTVTLRGLTRTSLDRLAPNQASNVSGSMTGRLHLPYRPGNLRSGNQLFPAPTWYPDYPVNITWAHRNRLTETTPVTRKWDSASITPEDGTTYRVRVEAIQDNGTVDGLVVDTTVSGTSYSLDDAIIPSHLAGSPFMRVSVWAVREGLQSWTAAAIRFRGPLRAPEIIDVRASLWPPEIIDVLPEED